MITLTILSCTFLTILVANPNMDEVVHNIVFLSYIICMLLANVIYYKLRDRIDNLERRINDIHTLNK